MMEAIKTTAEYTIYKKRSGRFGVQGNNKKWINGEEKIKILLDAKLIKATPSKKIEEPTEESSEATAPQATAASTDEKTEA